MIAFKSLACNVMYKLLYPSIRVRTAPPVSVRVRVVIVLRCNAIAHTVLHVSQIACDFRAIFVLPQLSKVLPTQKIN